MHATLPKELMSQEIKKRIEDMEDGESGSAFPYCMAADSDYYLWLDPGALVVLNKSGHLKIQKVKDDYEVVVNSKLLNYRWERGKVGNKGYLNQYTIPVTKIIVED